MESAPPRYPSPLSSNRLLCRVFRGNLLPSEKYAIIDEYYHSFHSEVNMNKRITPGAIGYIIINVIVFAAMFLRDPSLSSQTMIDFGAKTNFQIADGKLWYLITPMFLHGSILHLFFNSMAIYFFGPYVELFFGTKKFILISLLTGVFSSLGSFIFSDAISLGASGVIYGYLAFHIYLLLLNREIYLRTFGKEVFVLIAFNILYSFLAANIDLAGHLFGFIGGLAVYFLVGRKLPQRFPQRLLAVVFIIIMIAGGTARALAYRDSADYYIRKLNYYYLKEDLERYLPLAEEFLTRFPEYIP